MARAAASADERRLCTFMVAGERYGIDILTVREVHRKVSVTPVHGTAPAVRGLMNLRGQIVTVLDPAVRLGHERLVPGPKSRVVILKSAAEAGGPASGEDVVGLWVERVRDVVSTSPEAIGPPPPELGSRERLVRAVVQLEDDVVRVVDPAEMLRLEEVA